HATSSGKVILAFLSPDEREQVLKSLSLARHTEQTVTSLPALRASLEAIRRAGVCVTTDELVSGASGIAAPVFDRYGRVAGACAYGVRVWRYWDRHVATDDAFVEADISPVSSRVRGTVVQVLAHDNQEVPVGAPLVRLDPRDLEMKVHQARAALATAESHLRT